MVNYTSIVNQGQENIIIETRSDTFTKPDKKMLEFMVQAKIGDDVYDEDISVNSLQEYAADLLGKEAAIFLNSGTQSNLTAVLCHCARGEEVIIGDIYHIYLDEARGASVLGGVTLSPIKTNNKHTFTKECFLAEIKSDDIHFPISRLLSLENTVWGKAIAQDHLDNLADIAHQNGLSTHLDGARLMHASLANNVSPRDMVKNFDTVSLCLSKGLGAPMGTILAGKRDLIRKAKRIRKMLGGGTRQIGYMAACGYYALHNNINRLADDHMKAKKLYQALIQFQDKMPAPPHTDTNMVFMHVYPSQQPALQEFMLHKGIMISNATNDLRLVMHKDISDDDVNNLIDAFQEFYG